MTRNRVLGLVGAGLAAVLLGISVPSFAGTSTANVGVSSSVTNNCTLTSSPTLAIGAYDPIVTNKTTSATGTGTIDVTCTNGAAWSLDLDAGQNSTHAITGTTRAAAGPNSTFAGYEIYQDSAHTTVWGTGAGNDVTGTGSGVAQTQTLYAMIPAGQHGVEAGTYSDTVLATVNF
jgi:spore coat protein U-like protein